MFTVGLDLHATRSSLEILDSDGKRFKHLEVRGRWPKLFEAIDREIPKPFAIAYEASCGYGYVHDQLARRASRVEVAHPGPFAGFSARRHRRCVSEQDKIRWEARWHNAILAKRPSEGWNRQGAGGSRAAALLFC